MFQAPASGIAGAVVGSRSPLSVPDDVWEEAAAHYNEAQLAALVVAIAAINAFNRINATTRQISGDWVSQLVGLGRPTEQAA